MWKLVRRQEEEQRRSTQTTQEVLHWAKHWKQSTSKESHTESPKIETHILLRFKWSQMKCCVPLDALEGAASHVHDAACRTSDHTHQTFADTFKESCCSLLLCPYRHRYRVRRFYCRSEPTKTHKSKVCSTFFFLVVFKALHGLTTGYNLWSPQSIFYIKSLLCQVFIIYH